MPHSREIRGEFIRQYAKRKEKMGLDGWELIAARDRAHRALNIEFGFAEPDGSFGIGCKSHVDAEYKRRYDEIQSDFKKPYDKNLPAFYDWCREQGITIFEFLFFDNIYDDHLRAIAKASEGKDDWSIWPISLKAQLLVEKLKADHYIGEIRKRLDMEIAHQHYANTRCRKFFGLRPWSISEQAVILEYSRQWRDALNSAFNRLTAALCRCPDYADVGL